MRVWVARLLLESYVTQPAVFATLTYDEDQVPVELVPRDLTLFLKRLRKVYKVRYYAVGEYGDKTFRPHYHALLYGLSVLDQAVLTKTWGKGFVHVGEVNETTIRYTVGYIGKKMTKTVDPRLKGRHPEFARMSKHPGLGARALDAIGETLTNERGSAFLAQADDVPSTYRLEGRLYPLGDYLRRRLRLAVGAEPTKPVVLKRADFLKFDSRTPEEQQALDDKRLLQANTLKRQEDMTRARRRL